MFIHFFSIIYKFISIYKNHTLFLILNYYEAIESILFQQSLHIQNSFFFFFHFSMFTFFIITENSRKVFFRKYSYFNSTYATHSLRIHRAVLPKNSAESYPKSTSRRNFKAIKSILLP